MKTPNRLSTGIPGLDEIIRGGIPRQSLVLLAGGPGTGKTTLSMQFLITGAHSGERGLYVSFSESTSELRRAATSLGWTEMATLEKQGKLRLIDFPIVRSQGLDTLLDNLIAEVKNTSANRLVIDSITSLTMGLDEKVDTRILLTLLRRSLKETGSTTVLITETPWGSQGIGNGSEEFIADGIVLLEMVQQDFELRRRLVVVKMRGVMHDMRYYRFNIVQGEGIVVIPFPETKS